MLRQEMRLGARHRLKFVVPEDHFDADALEQQPRNGPANGEIGAIEHEPGLVAPRTYDLRLDQPG